MPECDRKIGTVVGAGFEVVDADRIKKSLQAVIDFHFFARQLQQIQHKCGSSCKVFAREVTLTVGTGQKISVLFQASGDRPDVFAYIITAGAIVLFTLYHGHRPAFALIGHSLRSAHCDYAISQ